MDWRLAKNVVVNDTLDRIKVEESSKVTTAPTLYQNEENRNARSEDKIGQG